jgi:hypothetical protein
MIFIITLIAAMIMSIAADAVMDWIKGGNNDK